MSHIGDPNLPFDTRYTKFSHTFLLTLLFFVVVCLKTVKTREKTHILPVYVVNHCCNGKHTHAEQMYEPWSVSLVFRVCVCVCYVSLISLTRAHKTQLGHTPQNIEKKILFYVCTLCLLAVYYSVVWDLFPSSSNSNDEKKNINKNLRRIFLAPIFISIQIYSKNSKHTQNSQRL